MSDAAQTNFVAVQHPLLSHQAYELVQQLPERLRLTNWVHRSVVEQLAPSLTKYPIDNQGLWAPYKNFHKLRLIAAGYEYGLKRLSSVLRTNKLLTLSMAPPLTDHELIVRTNLAGFLRALLEGPGELHDYVDRGMTAKAYARFVDGDTNQLGALLQLANFSLWLASLSGS